MSFPTIICIISVSIVSLSSINFVFVKSNLSSKFIGSNIASFILLPTFDIIRCLDIKKSNSFTPTITYFLPTPESLGK